MGCINVRSFHLFMIPVLWLETHILSQPLKQNVGLDLSQKQVGIGLHQRRSQKKHQGSISLQQLAPRDLRNLTLWGMFKCAFSSIVTLQTISWVSHWNMHFLGCIYAKNPCTTLSHSNAPCSGKHFNNKYLRLLLLKPLLGPVRLVLSSNYFSLIEKSIFTQGALACWD